MLFDVWEVLTRASVADPDHFDTDPAFHFDSDPNFHFDTDPEPTNW